MLMDNESPKVYTVSRLTEAIQSLLEEKFDFVWVEGEISNFRAPASGHFYMVLKDEGAQIRAVMFRLQGRYLKFLPENGMKVLARGKVGIYPPRGEYQIILDYLEPLGVGALALAFEQLKRKLEAEGIFDRDKKKPLPFLPQRVAVITSPTGAAIRDFLKIIRRRFANIEIIVIPVRVQGEGASADMVKALDLANEILDVDVIVLTRGGGSMEDLWAFNEEELALAIRRSRIPVVSAVGHEIDVTISDMASDLRAPTPSAAAELLVVEKESLMIRLQEIRDRLVSYITYQLRNSGRELERLAKGLRDPRRRLADNWLRLDEIHGRLLRGMGTAIRDGAVRLRSEGRALVVHSPLNLIASYRQILAFQEHALLGAAKAVLKEKHAVLSLQEKRLDALSPMSTLERGYSITRRLPEKQILKHAKHVRQGDRVEVLLAHGEMACVVEQVGSNRDA